MRKQDEGVRGESKRGEKGWKERGQYHYSCKLGCATQCINDVSQGELR